jgi:signal recognition particle GTPase
MFGFKPGKKPPVDEISDAGQGGGLFASLRARLSRTRSTLSEGLADAILGKKEIDEDLLEDVETRLLMGDVGVEATRRIVDSVSERVRRKELPARSPWRSPRSHARSSSWFSASTVRERPPPSPSWRTASRFRACR